VDEQYQLSLSSIEKADRKEEQQEEDEDSREKSRRKLNASFPQGGMMNRLGWKSLSPFLAIESMERKKARLTDVELQLAEVQVLLENKALWEIQQDWEIMVAWTIPVGELGWTITQV
jgi:hypothetical protein